MSFKYTEGYGSFFYHSESYVVWSARAHSARTGSERGYQAPRRMMDERRALDVVRGGCKCTHWYLVGCPS